ncbi:hypothetical protein T484DRAFT_1987360 [Baffinella frigidus]|nr:hypothetical protein T484DRAFT_1987360 [Cryptophyta sp. CCMP2293]
MTGQHGGHLLKVKPSAESSAGRDSKSPARRDPVGHAHSRHGVVSAPFQVLPRPSSALPNFRHRQDPRGHLQEILDRHAPGSESLRSCSRDILHNVSPSAVPRSRGSRCTAPKETPPLSGTPRKGTPRIQILWVPSHLSFAQRYSPEPSVSAPKSTGSYRKPSVST